MDFSENLEMREIVEKLSGIPEILPISHLICVLASVSFWYQINA